MVWSESPPLAVLAVRSTQLSSPQTAEMQPMLATQGSR